MSPIKEPTNEVDSLNQLFQDQLLVSQVPPTVWGVLLSLSPDDYKTVLLERTQSTAAAAAAATGKFGYTIGRHKTCDIRIQNPHVSNRHCLIYRMETTTSRCFLEDTSTNGTFVNHRRVGGKHSVELRDGDEIQLVKYQPEKGMKQFSDRFYVFQNLEIHRQQERPFTRNYLLTERLGKGAFAEVRVAVNRVTGERYAAKIVDRNRIPQIEKRHKLDENFKIETSILSRVRHPSVVQVHGVFREGDLLYLVLDLASDGELFDEIVRREFLSEDDTRKVILQLLLALRYLHRLGIVHRDIKLENILLADKRDLRIKLADFGLAKVVGESVFMKTVCGTPMYVAPEVLTVRKVGRYDSLVDIWSLGVVLYICLCGFPPFSDELAPPPMRDQIVSGMYSFMSPFWDHVSTEAIDLVCRMLQVDPQQRIGVEEALGHPWLRARRRGSVWEIQGISGFGVREPEEPADSQRTQSVGGESQMSQTPLGSPHFVNKPKLPPSSPPSVMKQEDLVLMIASSSSKNNPLAVETPRDAGGTKRKRMSFMRSQSDLGLMADAKRPAYEEESAGMSDGGESNDKRRASPQMMYPPPRPQPYPLSSPLAKRKKVVKANKGCSMEETRLGKKPTEVASTSPTIAGFGKYKG